MVTTSVQTSHSHRDLTIEHEFIEQTGLHAVVEQRHNELKRSSIFVSHLYTLITPNDHWVIAHLVVVCGIACKAHLLIGLALRDSMIHETAEGLLNEGLGSLCIEVTYDDKRHVRGHIPSVVKLNQLAQAGVLQMLGLTNYRQFVRVTLIELLEERVLHLRVGVVRIHIVLLKHVFKLSLERTENGINQTLREDGEPFLHLISGEGVVVARHVVRGVCVYALRTDTIEQIKEVLGSAILRSLHRFLVDARSQLLAYSGVGSLCILVIEDYDRVIKWFLFLPIDSTNLLGALKEHMLQIVSKTRVFARFINSTCTRYNIAFYVGLIMIFPQDNGEAVIQFVLLQFLRKGCFSFCKNRNAQEGEHQ